MQVDVGDQEKPRHSHSTVMFGTGREKVVTVTNGGQSSSNDQPLGLAFPYLINSVFHLEKGTCRRQRIGKVVSYLFICIMTYYRNQISKLDCHKNNLQAESICQVCFFNTSSI